MRRLTLLGVYLCLLPCVLLALAGYLVIILTIASPKNHTLTTNTQFQTPPARAIVAVYVPEEREARVEVLTEFFKRYDSPLLAQAQHIVDVADKYGIDWRLIPAIAMQESTLCQKIPKNSHNCWGFGIYGGKVTRFDNYSEAIETVSKSLARDYKANGLETPHEIVTKYTPGSETWAKSVSYVGYRFSMVWTFVWKEMDKAHGMDKV